MKRRIQYVVRVLSRYPRIRRAAFGLLCGGFCLVLLTLTGLGALLLWPLDETPFLRGAASPFLAARDGRILHPFLNAEEQWRFEIPLESINPWLIEATLAAEDQRFYVHPGVDPVAVARAAGQNVVSGRVVSGASTLTMQLVKMTIGGERSMASKARQALMALRLEARATKSEILAAYLNKAPYGMNLVGCEAAARRYFGKSARELTLAEAALLAGLPRSPSRLNPLRHPEAARARRDFVLVRMKQDGRISEAQWREAQAQPLDVAWHSLPALTPHLARRLSQLIESHGEFRSTIDADAQAQVEAALRRHVASLPSPVNNAAAIVVDVRTAEVLARAGSVDFFSVAAAGQVDAARALRSPGSTLKPFLFALAMDRHQLYASEKFLDAALDYGLYNPSNFDENYSGLVSASEALRQSLNVPAVAVLERLGADAALDELRRFGFSSLTRSAEYYGLGLALGGGEVRLEELAEAYTTLAAFGVHRPLKVWRHDAGGGEAERAIRGDRLLSRDVCPQIFTMLSANLDEVEYTPDVSPAGPRRQVCWKTGTSTGRRDAWAVAFDSHHIVAVWVGNSQGKSSSALTGAEAALPLALELFRSLPASPDSEMPGDQDDLFPVEVCSRSGLPASVACPAVEKAMMGPSQILNRRCALHWEISDSDGRQRVVERWPASARHWDLASIERASVIPATAGDTEIHPVSYQSHDSIIDRPLRILSPVSRAEFILTGDPRGDSVRLRTSNSDRETLTWYLNGRFIGRSNPETPLWLPLEAGEHALACMDAAGKTARVTFVVHQLQNGVD